MICNLGPVTVETKGNTLPPEEVGQSGGDQ